MKNTAKIFLILCGLGACNSTSDKDQKKSIEQSIVPLKCTGNQKVTLLSGYSKDVTVQSVEYTILVNSTTKRVFRYLREKNEMLDICEKGDSCVVEIRADFISLKSSKTTKKRKDQTEISIDRITGKWEDSTKIDSEEVFVWYDTHGKCSRIPMPNTTAEKPII